MIVTSLFPKPTFFKQCCHRRCQSKIVQNVRWPKGLRLHTIRWHKVTIIFLLHRLPLPGSEITVSSNINPYVAIEEMCFFPSTSRTQKALSRIWTQLYVFRWERLYPGALTVAVVGYNDCTTAEESLQWCHGCWSMMPKDRILVAEQSVRRMLGGHVTFNTPFRSLLELDRQSEGPDPIYQLITLSSRTYILQLAN